MPRVISKYLDVQDVSALLGREGHGVVAFHNRI